jgi:hypothetical protein
MPGPTCSVCNDTHVMPTSDEEIARRGAPHNWACTSCPTPCEKCRGRFRDGGASAFCAETPCVCRCHRPTDKSEPPSLLSDESPAELAAVFARAGVDQMVRIALHQRARGQRTLRVDVVLLHETIDALLADAVRQDRRWAERIKRLEGRIGFAVDALRGKHDDEASR